MWRGTTPPQAFTLPDGMSGTDFEVVYITYSQDGETIIEKTASDMTFEGRTIRLTLSQADTLQFKPGPVKIQLRARLPTGEAIASNVISTTAKEVLKDGEI